MKAKLLMMILFVDAALGAHFLSAQPLGNTPPASPSATNLPPDQDYAPAATGFQI
jgi:hypothetical protein